jgi:hypothetical protein
MTMRYYRCCSCLERVVIRKGHAFAEVVHVVSDEVRTRLTGQGNADFYGSFPSNITLSPLQGSAGMWWILEYCRTGGSAYYAATV